MASIVTGAWTAFEILASDLWIESVNAQPTYLASLTGTGSRIESLAWSKTGAKKKTGTAGHEERPSSEDDLFSNPPGDKKVPLSIMHRITRGDYDLSKKMGSLLINSERVKFISLKAIREAYSLAFSEKVRRVRTKGIDEALAAKSLDALSAVRNLIVHRGGVADAMYVEDCKAAPTAPRLNEKESLQLNGEICQKLIDPVLKASVELVRAVDSWLTFTRS